MFYQKMKKAAAAILAFAVAVSLPIAAFAEDTANYGYHKNEVVYGQLESGGAVRAIYVVNQFEVDTPSDIIDYGDYITVANLSNTDPLNWENKSVNFHAEAGDFYYQGDLGVGDLPWDFKIKYMLDGAPVDAAGLSGASGFLEMHIITSENERISDSTFYDNYMLQISVSIPSECASDIAADGGTTAVAGQNMSVNFTVMPGTDGDFTLTAKIHDFYSDGVQVTGMPLSMKFDAFDTESWIEDLEKLTDAIDELNEGTSALLDGAYSLNSGAKDLKDGSVDIRNGLSQLNQGSAGIKSASSNINTALQQMAAGVSGGSGSVDLSSFTTLPSTLSQLAQSLTDISTALHGLDQAYAAAYSALDSAISAVPSGTLSDAEIGALYAATDISLHGTLDTLVANYTAAQTIAGTYAGTKPAFDAVASSLSPTIDGINAVAAGLNDIAANLQTALDTNAFMTQMMELSNGITTLAANYAAFDAGLNDYVNGLSAIASGYPAFNSGVSKLTNGVGSITGGIEDLADGTDTMADETEDMPQQMQDKIDEMTAVFSGDDFEPISFVDSRNPAVSLVQFVMIADAISSPDDSAGSASSEEETEETVWDRLSDLFK